MKRFRNSSFGGRLHVPEIAQGGAVDMQRHDGRAADEMDAALAPQKARKSS